MKSRFHPAAEAEIREAAGWYHARDSRIAQRFTGAVHEALCDIEKWPLADSPWPGEPGFRLVGVRGFPYRLVYEPSETGSWILACAHHKRRPGYWAERA